jgi:hypothetical protein
MGCGAKIEQVVPTRWDYKVVPAVCGQTSIHGTELRCDKCSNKRPWYICKHGNDVSEWQCDACEIESYDDIDINARVEPLLDKP